MKFKIDENLPHSLAKFLNENGHNAESVYFENLIGISDDNLIKVCQKENRCLITLDADFADLKKYPPEKYSGVILIKIKSQGKNEVMDLFKKVLPFLNHESLSKNCWIIDNEKITIKNLTF